MFEYAAYAFFGIDMQEDMLIDGFSSYFLMGTHNATEVIDGITQTVIYYADGTKVILGGYLDVGLFDTLNDMLVCLMGASSILRHFLSTINWGKAPQTVGSRNERVRACQAPKEGKGARKGEMMRFEISPVIAAVRSAEEYAAALESGAETVFVVKSDLLSLREMLAEKRGKQVFVHADTCEGSAKTKWGWKFSRVWARTASSVRKIL